MPPLFSSPKVLSSASDKVKMQKVSKNYNLDDSVSLYLFSLLELI